MSIWNVAVGECAGSRHRARGECSADAFAYLEVGGDRVLAAVADGAGSAAMGAQVAKIAVDTAVSALEEATDGFGSGIDLVWAATCDAVLWAVRAEIRRVAEEHGSAFDDFATTLLFADCSGVGAGFGLVGDGGIAVRDDANGISLPLAPMAGEFANETLFVTSNEGRVGPRVAWLDPVDAIAIFTDGIAPLAIDLASRAAHAPFFDPVFRLVGAEEAAQSTAQLQAFIESDRVDRRVDDDRTLLIAVRTPAPTVQSGETEENI